MSRAVVRCLLCGRPDALRKVVADMPSARALRVIRLPNSRSVPDSASPTTVATSLADFVISA